MDTLNAMSDTIDRIAKSELLDYPENEEQLTEYANTDIAETLLDVGSDILFSRIYMRKKNVSPSYKLINSIIMEEDSYGE